MPIIDRFFTTQQTLMDNSIWYDSSYVVIHGRFLFNCHTLVFVQKLVTPQTCEVENKFKTNIFQPMYQNLTKVLH